jgi:hypothetical protein
MPEYAITFVGLGIIREAIYYISRPRIRHPSQKQLQEAERAL